MAIYLLSPLVGLAPRAFGQHESHLLAFGLASLGILSLEGGVYLVMVVSTGLIALGIVLLALGWRRIYRGREGLVTDGIYARLRHPQYLGLILIIVGFNSQ